MTRVRHAATALMALLALGGCKDEDKEPEGVCGRYDALAKRLGCEPAGQACTEPRAECATLVDTWLSCVANDSSQCLCEASTRQLNCEGSFKPDEGPARCIAEYQAFDTCLMALEDAGF